MTMSDDDRAQELMADTNFAHHEGGPLHNRDLSGLTNGELAARHASMTYYIDEATRNRGRIEMVLTQRMDDAEANQVPATDYVIERKVTRSYDVNRLAVLREILDPQILSEGYTPAHEETVYVDEKYDGRKLNSWEKNFGGQVRTIIEGARVETPARTLKITPREKKALPPW